MQSRDPCRGPSARQAHHQKMDMIRAHHGIDLARSSMSFALEHSIQIPESNRSFHKREDKDLETGVNLIRSYINLYVPILDVYYGAQPITPALEFRPKNMVCTFHGTVDSENDWISANIEIGVLAKAFFAKSSLSKTFLGSGILLVCSNQVDPASTCRLVCYYIVPNYDHLVPFLNTMAPGGQSGAAPESAPGDDALDDLGDPSGPGTRAGQIQSSILSKIMSFITCGFACGAE